MTTKKDDNINSSEQLSSSEEKLIAINFRPIQGSTSRSSIRLSPLKVTVGLGFLVSMLIMWFLLTAKSLIISISPPEAEPRINIYGGLNFQLSDNYLIRPGGYSLKALAPGYVDLNHIFSVDEKDHTKIELTMKKKPGHLEITTEPSGSEILMNNKLVGLAPFNIKSLQSGEHSINLNLPRYKTKRLNVQIKGLDIQQNLHVDLEPNWGFIELSSSPTGAQIRIDGKFAGITPFTAPILSSGELVSISFDGYKTWSKKLSVNSNETKKLSTVSLEPVDGVINLVTSPPEATVTMDGEYIGNTPLTLYLDAQEEHSISIFLNGYLIQKKSISLSSGEERNITLKLKPDIGIIKVLVSPKDSSVWIEKKLLGIGDGSFELPSHPQLLEIKRAGYETYKKNIIPQPQFEQTIKVQLLTKEEAYWANIPREIVTINNHVLKYFRPKGDFLMGAPRQENGRRANEVLRKVNITRPFYIANKEVTNKQYWQFQKHSSRHFRGKTLDMPEQPVVNISWEQAALYCNWLSKIDRLDPFYKERNGKITGSYINSTGYRLPTEAEWSWVARFQEPVIQPESFGDYFSTKNKSGNFADLSASDILSSVIPLYDDGAETTAVVGSFDANSKGLYDLQGNVSEWVHDFYEIKFNLNDETEIDPMGPKTGEFKTIRGSSWRDSDISTLRPTYRDMGNNPSDDVGFRIARYIKPVAKK
ncbi:MAG: PEGA domain-containing protein [Gammaproteobacteria bacterium]|jgi:formylglycine-generating enzyme required for sulfatase activity|nr:PEGA domain-containing protein [Gammaproteobacteria bacterium]MDA7736731.1 PEGA domain-containing protein [Porticoccus sp.]MDC0888054.1 PEGA domain-containing protein [Porticoccus sp.]